jgi:uncharacterized membrane protein YuzA (DUF378 family)
MKWLNIVTLLLVIIGGVNWGLVALGGHEMDLVANIFGGDDTSGARLIYALVGLSALWQIVPFVRALSSSQAAAEAGSNHRVHTTR